MRPYDAEFNFYFFDIDSIVPGHTMLLAPVKDFKNHYLFRGKNKIDSVSLLPSGAVQVNSGTVTSVSNGVVTVNGSRRSFERYISFQPGSEFKTYIFNAAYDKNLYSEISLLIASVKHNGMSVYDFKKNTIVKGSIVQDVLIDPVTDMVMHRITMKNTKDFFNNPYGFEFEFIYAPRAVLSKTKLDSITNLNSFGMVYKTDVNTGERELIPLSSDEIDVNQEGSVSASNNRLFISVNRERMRTFSMDRMIQNGLPKKISNNDSIHGIYSIENIDYEDKTISISKGTNSDVYQFSDYRLNSILARKDSSSILVDQPTDFAGIVFKMPVMFIDMNFINIETFSDAVLLTRVVEEADYGIEKIIKDCGKFAWHIYIQFAGASVLVIFNKIKDKIYYIEFDRKVVNTDSNNLELVLDRLIEIPDERLLKEFLFFHSLGKSNNKIPGASQIITTSENGIYAQRIESFPAVKEDFSLGRYSVVNGSLVDIDLILSGRLGNILYSPKEYSNKDLVRNFMKSKFNFRPIFNGVLSSANHSILTADLVENKLTLSVFDGSGKFNISIEKDAGTFELRKGYKVDLISDASIFEEIVPYDIMSNQSIYKIYQVFDMIVVEFEFGGRIAFLAPMIDRMISVQDLSIDGSISFKDSDFMTMLRLSNVASFDISNYANQTREKASSFFVFENNDVILDIIPNNKMDYYLDRYDFDDNDTSFFVTSNGVNGISIPMEQVKHCQIKEL